MPLSRQKKYPSAGLGEKHWETYPSTRTFKQTSIQENTFQVGSLTEGWAAVGWESWDMLWRIR